MKNTTLTDFLKGKFKYDEMGAYIWLVEPNGNHQKIADIRGWGGIQNLFKDKDGLVDTDAAAKFQDELGQFIVSALTEKLSFPIIDLEKERFEWSLKTFPESTALSSLQHLKKEIKEIEQDIAARKIEPIEYADCLMCLFDSAGRQGISPEQIFTAFKEKLRINKYERTWVKNPDNTYSHTKTTSSTTKNK